MSFGNQDIHFKVDGELLRVIRIDNEKNLQKVGFSHKMEKKFFEEHKDYEKSSKVWRKLPC